MAKILYLNFEGNDREVKNGLIYLAELRGIFGCSLRCCKCMSNGGVYYNKIDKMYHLIDKV